VFPVKANVTLSASVGGVVTGGFALALDGQPVRTSPHVHRRGGVKRSIAGPGVAGGERGDVRLRRVVGQRAGHHTIATPARAATYTARYTRRGGTPIPAAARPRPARRRS
jgi:hypothetical protein